MSQTTTTTCSDCLQRCATLDQAKIHYALRLCKSDGHRKNAHNISRDKTTSTTGSCALLWHFRYVCKCFCVIYMISLVYVGTLCLHKSVNRSRWPFQTIMFCCESCDSRWLFQTCSAASRAITRLMRRTKSSCTWRESIWRKSFRVIIVASCFPQKSLQLWDFCHRTVSHLNVHFISITFKSLLVWHANSHVHVNYCMLLVVAQAESPFGSKEKGMSCVQTQLFC